MKSVIIIIVGMLLFNILCAAIEYLLSRVMEYYTEYTSRIRIVYFVMSGAVLMLVIPGYFVVYAIRLIRKATVLCEQSTVFELNAPQYLFKGMLILVFMWGCGAVVSYWKQTRELRKMAQKSRAGYALNEEYQRIFEEECERLGIINKPQIQFNEYVDSAYVFYKKGKYIIEIPENTSTAEEFRCICRHELIHVKKKDHRWDIIFLWLNVINWYNILVTNLALEMDMWIEICRDMEVIEQGDITVKQYYQCMGNHIWRQLDRKSVGVRMFARKGRLTRRMQIVAGYFNGKSKKVSNKKAVIGLVIIMAGVIMLSYIGIYMVKVGYKYVYEAMINKEQEKAYGEVGIEYSEKTADGLEIMQDWKCSGEDAAIDCTLEAGARIESVDIYLEAGQTLNLGGIAFGENLEFRYGYTNHEVDTFYYGELIYDSNFLIKESGYYSIFFENLSSEETLLIGGGYRIE